MPSKVIFCTCNRAFYLQASKSLSESCRGKRKEEEKNNLAGSEVRKPLSVFDILWSSLISKWRCHCLPCISIRGVYSRAGKTGCTWETSCCCWADRESTLASKLSPCENHSRALNSWPLVNTGPHYYSPCARQDKECFNIPSRGSSVIVGTASYWFLWGWNKYCCRDQSCEPPISHSLSLAVEVAEENYPEHGYTANTLNLQDTAVPEPR